MNTSAEWNGEPPRSRVSLAERIVDLEDALLEASTRARVAETRLERLVQLLAMTAGLQSVAHAAQVCEIIKTTIATFVGCDQIGIYRNTSSGAAFRYVDGVGLDLVDFSSIPRTVPWVADALSGLTPQFRRGDGHKWHLHGRRVASCVPLVDGSELIGIIVLFELPLEKPHLLPDDEALLAFLGLQATYALTRWPILATWSSPLA